MLLTRDTDAAVWLVRVPESTSDSPCEAHLATLPAHERAACGRYRNPERQARYATGRALIRHLLGDALGCGPTEVPIALDRRRRPFLDLQDDPAGGRNLDFNLSSTPGFVLCAVARTGRVGIDIEGPGRALDWMSLAARVFTPDERRWMGAEEHPEQAFLRLWTLKESLAKADGEGLGLPFAELTVLPQASGHLIVDLAAMGDKASDWHLAELETDVPAAIALRGPFHRPARIDLAPALPGGIPFKRIAVRGFGASFP